MVRLAFFPCLAISLIAIGAAPATQSAATRPAHSAASGSLADRSADQKAGAAVSAAIRELLHEFSGASSGSSSAKLRTASDYFHQHPSPDVTAKAIFGGLEQKIVDDPAASAYVKWQLLSGIGAKFDDALVQRGIELYCSAPEPIANASNPGEPR